MLLTVVTAVILVTHESDITVRCLYCPPSTLLTFFVFLLTSPRDRRYNCIAWAAGETHRKWWPDKMETDHWPVGVPRRETLDAFEAAFGTLGYTPCDNPELEKGFEKVALYTWAAGTPKHAARQLPDGTWTSKLGREHDIRHELNGVEGRDYGVVKRILKRPVVRDS